MELQDRKNFLLNFAFIAAVGSIIYLTFKFMLAYLLPFLIGIVISFIIQKPAAMLSKKIKIRKGICAAVLSVLSYLLVLAVVALLAWLIISRISTLINIVSKNTDYLTVFIENINDFLKGITVNFPKNAQSVIKNILTDTAGEFATKAGTFLTGIVTSLVKNIPAFFISGVVTVVATCYISKDFDSLKKFVKNLIKPSTYKNIVTVKNILFDCVFKFFRGYLLLIGITFTELIIGLMLLGVEHFLLLAIAISLIDILPVLGTGTVLIPWAIVLFLQENFSLAIGILILYLIVCVVRNFIEPKIIGDRIGINPLFTLIAMFLGLRLAGIAGMIVLPLTMIIIITFYKQQIDEEKLRTQ